MTIGWQQGEGWGSVTAYAIPGIPFLFTGTSGGVASKIAFPLVTKYIEVKNTSANGSTQLAVGFSKNGVESGSQYITLAEGEEKRFDVRVTEVWVLGATGTPTFDISAGLSSASLTSPLTGSSGAPYKGIG